MTSLRSLFLVLPLAAVTGLSMGSTGVRAEMPGVAESQQALQQRLDALGQHFHGGSLARWSNPDDHKVLADMWAPELLGTPPYDAKDVSALVTMLKAQASVLQRYTTAGKAIPGSPKEARVRTKYQDEIVRASAFLTNTSAALLEAMGDFTGKLQPGQLKPEQRKGIDEGRAGVRSLLESFYTELQLPDVSSENKMLLLDALAKNADTIAVYSPDEDRKRYVHAAGAVLAGLSAPEKAKLQAFISAMDTKACKGLCTLRG